MAMCACTPQGQTEEAPYITVSPTTLEAGYTVTIADVAVESNVPWVLTRTDETGADIDWVKVTAISGKGDKSMQVKVLENPTQSERSAVLTFTAGSAIAYLDITQAANPNEPTGPEPDRYGFPMFQPFTTGRGMDIESGAVKLFDPSELAIENAKVKGGTITFTDGMVIEAVSSDGSEVSVKTASPTHTNPKKNAGFMDGFCLSGFTSGTITYTIPFYVEVSGKVRMIKGQRREKDDSYEWSTDGGSTWNPIGPATAGKSDASWKYLDFEIPSDKKVEPGKSLIIRENVTYNASATYGGIMLGCGIALVPQEGDKSSVPAPDGKVILFSDGFDSIIDAAAAPLIGELGFIKSLTSGTRTAASYTAAAVAGMDPIVEPTLCYSRPGFLQIGFADESQATTATEYYLSGSYKLRIGEKLKAAGISSADLTVTFKAAGMNTAYEEPCNAAPVLSASAGTVSDGGAVTLAMDSWKEYSFTVKGADQTTVLELTSTSAETGAISGKADNRFFIDDIVVSAGGDVPGPQPDVLTLTFDFSTCPEGWPSGKEEYESTDHSEKEHPYVLDGVTYTFSSTTCLEIAATSKRAIVWGFDGTNEQQYYVLQNHRFFGLPAVDGYRLSCFKFTQACSNNASRKAGITSEVTRQNEQEGFYVAGGEAQTVDKNGTEYTFNLTSTEAGKRYYFAPTGKASGFATITLEYSKAN